VGSGGRRPGACRRGSSADAQLHAVLLELELRDVLCLEDPEDLLEVRDVHTLSLGRPTPVCRRSVIIWTGGRLVKNGRGASPSRTPAAGKERPGAGRSARGHDGSRAREAKQESTPGDRHQERGHALGADRQLQQRAEARVLRRREAGPEQSGVLGRHRLDVGVGRIMSFSMGIPSSR